MKSRVVLIFLSFLLVWTVIVIRGAQLQIFPSQRLVEQQNKRFNKIVTLRSRRGAILDRAGRELAVTVSSHSLYADPKLIKNPTSIAKKLAPILGVSRKSIYKKIAKRSRRFVWLKRHLDKSSMRKISSWGERGLAFIEEPKRIYPNNSLLSHVLGFVGRDGKGLEGIELNFDDDLHGEKKTVNVLKDARGRPLFVNGRVFTDNPDGSTLTLTIDAELQFMLERELNATLDQNGAESAVGVILDAQTSEVLAMANSPGYDLNSANRYSQLVRKNRAVTDAFEPGSTMKTFVVAAALRDGLAQPNSKINCEGGSFRVGGRLITEADKRHNHDWLSVSEILAYSSNVGTAKLGLDLGAKKLRKALLDFGFGEKAKSGLPGESRGILHDLPWRAHLLSNISFGHGMTATPLQVASAYAAIASDGVLRQPRIVKSVENLESSERREHASTKIRRVLTPTQAATMRLMLTGVTSPSGTGYNARVVGFPVAGKTGTAQKVNPNGRGYLKGAYISSFAGFVPANNPKFVIYIAVDSPEDQYYGSQVAAPIFSRLATYAVRKAGLPPILLSPASIMSSKKVPSANKKLVRSKLHKKAESHVQTVPEFKGLSLREVYRRIRGKQLNIRVRGSGVVATSSPHAGDTIPNNRTIRLTFKPIN